MSDPLSTHLIVGLGNPGSSYEMTRHNMGFIVADALSDKWKISLKRHRSFFGEFGLMTEDDHRVMVLKPTTYMNLSGQAVKACVDFYKVSLKNMIVVCDDIALPFGKIRMRQSGSSGGHNGLKSIEYSLNTRDFPRMRIGVGGPEDDELKDYVLSGFSQDERHELPTIKKNAEELVDTWVFKGFKKALEVLSIIVASSKKCARPQDLGLDKPKD